MLWQPEDSRKQLPLYAPGYSIAFAKICRILWRDIVTSVVIGLAVALIVLLVWHTTFLLNVLRVL